MRRHLLSGVDPSEPVRRSREAHHHASPPAPTHVKRLSITDGGALVIQRGKRQIQLTASQTNHLRVFRDATRRVGSSGASSSLTDTQIRKAQGGITPIGVRTDKLYKMADGAGTYLEVAPRGSNSWRFKYRFSGKETRVSLGVYPDVSLKDARERRDQARKQLAAGIYPAEHKKARKLAWITGDENSFEIVARECMRQDPSLTDGATNQIRTARVSPRRMGF